MKYAIFFLLLLLCQNKLLGQQEYIQIYGDSIVRLKGDVRELADNDFCKMKSLANVLDPLLNLYGDEFQTYFLRFIIFPSGKSVLYSCNFIIYSKKSSLTKEEKNMLNEIQNSLMLLVPINKNYFVSYKIYVRIE